MFVHLRTHTEFSVLDGTLRIDDLVAAAAADGQAALAITDLSNLFGAVKFYKAARGAGLKPLIERLFAGWSAERSQVLAETLHDVVLGGRLDEIDRLATAAARPEVAQVRRLLFECGREFT